MGRWVLRLHMQVQRAIGLAKGLSERVVNITITIITPGQSVNGETALLAEEMMKAVPATIAALECRRKSNSSRWIGSWIRLIC